MLKLLIYGQLYLGKMYIRYQSKYLCMTGLWVVLKPMFCNINFQKKMIEHLCPVDGVAGFSSEDNVDYWDKNKWDYELSKHQVCRQLDIHLY